MSTSEKLLEQQNFKMLDRIEAIEEQNQIAFERETLSVCISALEIDRLDRLSNLEVGPVELTSINNAITKLQAFVLKHRRKVAA